MRVLLPQKLKFSRDPTLNHYADFRKAEAGGWNEVLNHLIFNENINPQELYVWAFNFDMTLRALIARATDLQIDFTANDNWAIKKASCMDGTTEIVELLLDWEGQGQLKEKRVDSTTENNQAIQWASYFSRDKVVELLLDWEGQGQLEGRRVNPTANNNHAIQMASGHYKVAKLLFDWKGLDSEGNQVRVDPTANNNEAIQWASQNGKDKVVKLLLDYNYAINWASHNLYNKVVALLKKNQRPHNDNNA